MFYSGALIKELVITVNNDNALKLKKTLHPQKIVDIATGSG